VARMLNRIPNPTSTTLRTSSIAIRQEVEGRDSLQGFGLDLQPRRNRQQQMLFVIVAGIGQLTDVDRQIMQIGSRLTNITDLSRHHKVNPIPLGRQHYWDRMLKMLPLFYPVPNRTGSEGKGQVGVSSPQRPSTCQRVNTPHRYRLAALRIDEEFCGL
jgi:hypothetical protein